MLLPPVNPSDRTAPEGGAPNREKSVRMADSTVTQSGFCFQYGTINSNWANEMPQR
jgi:hypothetical protein